MNSTKYNWIKAFDEMVCWHDEPYCGIRTNAETNKPYFAWKNDIKSFISQVEKDAIEKTNKRWREKKVDGDTSDGYHTFNELYEFRKLYNACLFNEWYSRGMYDVHKSKRHHDGEECFGGGWFIVTAQLPTGQISNHYELKDWDLFRCVALDKAKEWDGHTAQDVAKRLSDLLMEETYCILGEEMKWILGLPGWWYSCIRKKYLGRKTKQTKTLEIRKEKEDP